MEFLKGYNALVYLAAIVAAGFAIERWRPWRRTARIGFARWLRAIGLNLQAVVLLALIPVISGYATATLAGERGFGLLNAIAIPLWAELLVALVVADAAAFAQHWTLHRSPLLWRLHRTHHLDRDIDASTALRFHPFETLYRAAFEAPIIFLVGIPPEGVLFTYAALVVVNVVTHMNVALPLDLERFVGRAFITPRMHRLHHTTDESFQRANYGTFLAVWDRGARSLRGPDMLADDVAFGLASRQADRESFALLLMDPFRPDVQARTDHAADQPAPRPAP